MTENMKDGTVRGTARRRLIRGAFGAPAALTLYSGNVFAQASSSLRALKNQLADAKFPAPNLPEQPAPGVTWIRVPVWVGSGTVNNQTRTAVDVVKYEEVKNQPGCGVVSTFITMGGGWATVTESLPFTPSSQPVLADPRRWAALRFNALGQIVGVSAGSAADGTALTQSAGGSLVVGRCV